MRRVETTRRSRTLGVAVMAAALMLVLSGCSSGKQAAADSGAAAPKDRKLTLVAYSIPGEAYKKIIPAFQASWKAKTGENVTFTESYGGSGSQARAVADGLEADVVHLAMEPDVTKIQEAGLIDAGWQDRTKGKGVATTSLIVIGVRPGNPKAIKTWSDLSAKGVGVITPNPKTSGGAQWNLLADWGSVTLAGNGTEDQAYDQVRALYANTLVLDKNARDASNTFLQKGIGDAALLWESDALIGQAAGEKFDIIVPSDTILAETAATVVDANAKKHGTEDVAKAFVEFLFSPEAQKAFAETGLRPVDESVLTQYADKFPAPSGKLFTIADFGGWAKVTPQFFGDGTGTYSRIEAEVAKER